MHRRRRAFRLGESWQPVAKRLEWASEGHRLDEALSPSRRPRKGGVSTSEKGRQPIRKLLPLSSVALVCAALLTTPALAATNIGDLHCNDANGVALTLNSVVTIQGIVTANQPTGSANRFYIQDATGGVNVFGSPQDCTIAVGDELEVTGTVAQFNG